MSSVSRLASIARRSVRIPAASPRIPSCIVASIRYNSSKATDHHTHNTGTATSAPGAHAKHAGDERGMTFIERVKTYGANAMLGVFLTSGVRFDRVLDGMTVTKLGSGSVVCKLKVHEAIQNTYGTLHGGAISTIIDVVGTMALLTTDPLRPGVSVEMSTTFVSAAKANEELLIEGRVLKSGKRLGFSEVHIYRESDKALIATGRHTKAL